MIKKIKAFAVAAAMLITTLAVAKNTTVETYADGDVNITFHYTSSDGQYGSDKWSLDVKTESTSDKMLFFDENGVTTGTYSTSETKVICFVKDVVKSKQHTDAGGSGYVRDDGSLDKTITIDLTGKTGNVDVYLSHDSSVASFEPLGGGSVAETTTPAAEATTPAAEATTPVAESTTPAPETTVSNESANSGDDSQQETVKEIESDDPNADYSPSIGTVIVADVVILLVVAALCFTILGKKKDSVI